MIEQVDGYLKSWITKVLGDTTTVTFDPPPLSSPSEEGVSCYLLELGDNPPLRGNHRTPLQISLRYLVTTWAKTTEDAHRLLGKLAFAAMENDSLELDLEPVGPAIWQGLGIRPQACFFLRVPLRKERPEPEVARVREPIVIRGIPMVSLQGVVVGPGDVPIADANIEIPALGKRAVTDAQGRFHLAGIPAVSEGIELLVAARGQQQEIRVQPASAADQPLVVRFAIGIG